MNQVLLSRHTQAPRPELQVLGDMVLAYGRVHEACGRARRTLALLVAGKTGGPVIWIAPAWAPNPLNADGVHGFIPPQNMIFLSPHRPEDLLWCMEEVLRSGAVPLVVADLPDPPALTPIRRLHLAAESAGKAPPIGLLLTPDNGGCPGIESRWKLEPAHQPNQGQWQLSRLRARTAPVKSWLMRDVPSGLSLGT
jgi:protein ImuA